MPKVSAKAIETGPTAVLEPPSSERTEGLESSQPLPEEETPSESLATSPRQARLKPTPEPPYYKFHSDNPRGRRPNDFFAYWSGLGPEFRERMTAYVYRNWPVIAIMVPDKKRGGLKPTCQIAKIPGEDAIRDEDHLMRFKGGGDYTIRLNDATVRKSIALCVIKGLRSEDFPPVIDNYDQLVMDDPANKSFIEGLRQKGLLQGESDMAAGEVTSALTGTIDKLTDRLAEKESRPAAPPAPMQTPSEVTIKTLEMAGKAFDQGVALTKETMAAQADAKIAVARAESAGQQTPTQTLGFLKEVAELIQKLQPASSATAPSPSPAGSGEMLKELTGIFTTFMDREAKLQGTIMALQSTRMEVLERQLQSLISNPSTPAAQKDDLISTLEKFASVKDKLQGLLGGKESDDDDRSRDRPMPAWMQLAQSALQILPNTAASLVAMSHNLAVARTGQGAPIQIGALDPDAAALPSPSNPQPANPEPGASPMKQVYFQFLRAIEQPFINHLNDPNKTGADFAAWVSDGFGEIGYQSARELGKDALMTLLMSYKPIAQVMGQIPERANQFVDEFLTADQQDDGSGEAEELQRNFVAPAMGAPQVIDVPPVVLNQEAVRKRKKAAEV